MSLPLRDDGTVPLKRKMQLVLRITGDEPIEVVRDIKPLWTAESTERIPKPSAVTDLDAKEEMLKIMAEELHKAVDLKLLLGMLRHLMAKVMP